MLSARKIELLAGLKVRGLHLRQAELSFYMARFAMTAGISSILTYLSYVGVIKIKIPEKMLPPSANSWEVSLFYISTCATMSLALYNLVVTSFCIVYAQGLSLRGPPGSVARCVAIFRSQWRVVRVVLALSIASLVASCISISWMKLDERRFFYPAPSVLISFIVVSGVIAMVFKIRELSHQLRIPPRALITGDLTVDQQEGQAFDLVNEEHERIEASR